MKLSVCFLALALLAWCESLSSAAPVELAVHVDAFLQKHCLRCHAAEKQGGDFRIDLMSRDFADPLAAQKWSELITRVNAQEMPPTDEPQPSADEISGVIDWVSTQIKAGEAARMAARGPVAHYRLSRDEYANTVYDLLGVHYDVHMPGAFNEDPRWHGFERIGSQLSLSPSHVDRYFQAAETILQRAFPPQPPKPTSGRFDANAGREAWLAEHAIQGRVRQVLWPGKSGASVGAREAGIYRIRIQLSGLQPLGGKAPHLSLFHNKLKQSVYDQDVVAAEDQPAVIELELFLEAGSSVSLQNVTGRPIPEGHTLNILNSRDNVFINTRETRFRQPTGYKLTDDDGNAIYPLLLIDWVEWEGPLTSEADQHKRDGLTPAGFATNEANVDEARTCLKRFADRAWRRPATDAEVDRYVKIVESELAAGENFRSAYLAAMIGILTSKNFYYLEEGSADEPRANVNDWELASRLSYFLWGSLPDEALYAAAQAGDLSKQDVLRVQVARMLADPKIDRFTDAFPRQWLQLHKVGMFPPDKKLYPDYDAWLEKSMVLESVHYFREMFAKNLPLREFLVSDWTMLNPRLAQHYGLPPLAESGFQRVALKPEDHRGGLLTQAGILTLTSDGTRHRPVHRGVWVSEAIFATTPPPPPPNVEPLEPTPSNEPKATVRMQLQAHTTHAACAACHRKIDPLGFAFDNFDAIGRWRTEETVAAGKGENPSVDASGVLPDGRKFHCSDEFKQLLAADVDQFAEAFVEQLATFALRRVMTIDDRAQIKAIAAAAKADDYRLRTVLEQLVLSDLFQKR